MADKTIPADVKAAMDRGVRQRYAISEAALPKSKGKPVKY